MNRENEDKFLNFSDEAMLVVKSCLDTLNHPTVYINDKFKEIIGYSLEDIPDKDAWWKTAYPDPDYRIVVERQWELLYQDAVDKGECRVVMDVNIQTKYHGEKRFHVIAEIESNVLDGHYIVLFTNPEVSSTNRYS